MSVAPVGTWVVYDSDGLWGGVRGEGEASVREYLVREEVEPVGTLKASFRLVRITEPDRAERRRADEAAYLRLRGLDKAGDRH